MGEDFSAAPVRVLLSVRYANGIVISNAARALWVDESSVRVVSSEALDVGIQVSISAPFLKGLVLCWVASKIANDAYPGACEQELRFYEEMTLPAVRRRRDASDYMPEVFSPSTVSSAAQELAARLEHGAVFSFSRVIRGGAPKRRMLYCAVSAAALIMVLQEKSAVDVKRLIDAIRKVHAGEKRIGEE